MDNPQSLKTRSLTRTFSFTNCGQRTEADGTEVISIAMSSEYPVQRDFGNEVLDHSPTSVDMSRLMDGAPFLVNHNQNDQVGVLQNVTLDSDRVIRADVRFSRSQRGQDIKNDLADGIRRNISIGYQIQKAKVERNSGGLDTYRVVRWMPFEASTVAVPADPTVGVSRSADMSQETDVELVFPDDTTDERGLQITTEAVTVSATTETMTIDDEGNLEKDEYSYTSATNVVTTYTPVADSPEEEAADAIEDANTINPDDDASETEPEQRNIPLMAVSSRDTTPNTLSESRNMEHISNSAPIELSAKERKQYDLGAAVISLSDGKRSGLAFEISDTIAAQTGRSTDGFWMPTNLRTMTSNTTNAGAELVFTAQGEFIDLLYAKTTAISAGAKIVPVAQKVSYPRMVSGSSAQWTAEGSNATAQDLVFDNVTLDPKPLTAQASYTRKLAQISPFAVEQLIRDAFVKQFAVAIDIAAFSGSANAPAGLLNTSGLLSVAGTSGSLATFAMFVDAETQVNQANASSTGAVYVVTPALAGKLKQTLKNASGTDASFIYANGEINGYKTLVSNNLPWTTTVSHAAIFGDFSNIVIADGGAIEVIVDKVSGALGQQVKVTGQWMADVVVLQPKAFAKLTQLRTV